MLLLSPDVLAGAILLQAMIPLRDGPDAHLAGKLVLILSGRSDPIIPAANSTRLAAMLTQAAPASLPKPTR
jgi:phospholipase/carboxylesterase